jgi:hypothetical protein
MGEGDKNHPENDLCGLAVEELFHDALQNLHPKVSLG